MHIGIIGCGQLARMTALAGWNMGLQFTFLAEPEQSTRCVRGLGRVTQNSADYTPERLYIAMGEPDLITVEREQVDTALLRAMQAYCPVYPNPDALHTCQQRLREKQMIRDLGLATADFAGACTAPQVFNAVEKLGFPVVIKRARREDHGRQQWYIHNRGQLAEFCDTVMDDEWLIESCIDFEREVSVLAARSAQGEVAVYPATENVHQGGTLLTSIAPALDLPARVQAQCHQYMTQLLEHLDYVGVLAMECFVTEHGLLVHELAPRVHNSGHWTLRSEATSQFENHLRAIIGMSLGSTEVRRYNGIINILGDYHPVATRGYLSQDSAITFYNKTSAPGRKLGHINVWRNSREDIVAELSRLQHCLSSAPANSLQGRQHR